MSKIDKKAISQEIQRLFSLALNTDDTRLKKSAVKQAIQLSRSTRVKISRRYSLFICRKCLSVLSSPDAARIRVRKNRNWMLVIKCLSCGAIKRVPLEC
ncbi:MAG: hypothetical protein QXZ17_05570 [Nitrososphaerota archaeon]